MFLEESVCHAAVLGAEVRADTISCFRGGSGLQRQGRWAGLVMVAGSAMEACVFCVQEVLGKLWVLLHKAPEFVCGKTTGGRQRQNNKRFEITGTERLHLKPWPTCNSTVRKISKDQKYLIHHQISKLAFK